MGDRVMDLCSLPLSFYGYRCCDTNQYHIMNKEQMLEKTVYSMETNARKNCIYITETKMLQIFISQHQKQFVSWE